MTDRAIPSTNRPIAAEPFKGAILNGSLGNWIIPTTEDHYASDQGLAGTPLDAFGASWSSTSHNVTIDSGEGYVAGAWIGRDVETVVALDANTAGQDVAVGPARGVSDSLRIDVVSAFNPGENYTKVWTFDTDSNGVTGATDRRTIGAPLTWDDDAPSIDTGSWSLTVPINDELDRSTFTEAPLRIRDMTAYSMYQDRAAIYNLGDGWAFRDHEGDGNVFEVDPNGDARLSGELTLRIENRTNRPSGASAGRIIYRTDKEE